MKHIRNNFTISLWLKDSNNLSFSVYFQIKECKIDFFIKIHNMGNTYVYSFKIVAEYVQRIANIDIWERTIGH